MYLFVINKIYKYLVVREICRIFEILYSAGINNLCYCCVDCIIQVANNHKLCNYLQAIIHSIWVVFHAHTHRNSFVVNQYTYIYLLEPVILNIEY
jgi:hypothetical protein